MTPQLVIQLQDGQPIGHPILVENFLQVYPGVDLNNLPNNFAPFERVPRPVWGVYEVYEGALYQWVDGVVKDVHNIRPMSTDEILVKQNYVKEQWALNNGFSSWVFNEALCEFVAPKEKPNDGKFYRWDETTLDWILIGG